KLRTATTVGDRGLDEAQSIACFGSRVGKVLQTPRLLRLYEGLQEGSVAAPIVAPATTARHADAHDNRDPGRPPWVAALVEKKADALTLKPKGVRCSPDWQRRSCKRACSG